MFGTTIASRWEETNPIWHGLSPLDCEDLGRCLRAIVSSGHKIPHGMLTIADDEIPTGTPADDIDGAYDCTDVKTSDVSPSQAVHSHPCVTTRHQSSNGASETTAIGETSDMDPHGSEASWLQWTVLFDSKTNEGEVSFHRLRCEVPECWKDQRWHHADGNHNGTRTHLPPWKVPPDQNPLGLTIGPDKTLGTQVRTVRLDGKTWPTPSHFSSRMNPGVKTDEYTEDDVTVSLESSHEPFAQIDTECLNLGERTTRNNFEFSVRPLGLLKCRVGDIAHKPDVGRVSRRVSGHSNARCEQPILDS